MAELALAYGGWRCHERRLPPGSPLWESLSRVLEGRPLELKRVAAAEFALMLYRYHTHQRRDLTRDEYRTGRTGYTGVLQEMVDEVPRRGSARLQRKLSVDLNEIIPAVVWNPELRRRLVARVKAVAAEHNLPLYRPGTEEPKDKTQVASPGASRGTSANDWTEMCISLLSLISLLILAVLGWLCFAGLRAIIHRLHAYWRIF